MYWKITFLAFLFLFFLSSLYSDCSTCTNSGKIFCVETSECLDAGNVTCDTPINVAFNCPTSPRVAYDDTFMRKWITVFLSAVHNSNPQACFDNQLPTFKLNQVRTVNCSTDYSDVTCVAFTAHDTKNKVIVLTFKGTGGMNQLQQQLTSMSVNGTIPFFDNGRVWQIYYDSFLYLWNGGIQQDLRRLIYLYADYELLVTGHSMGGALATVASAYIARAGIFRSDRMKVVVFASPSVGTLEFAQYHWDTFPYSFHIVHRNDPVPINSVIDTVHNVTLYHQRTTVWYDNYMNPGDPYIICPEADGPYCNDEANQSTAYGTDHLYYFNILLPDWGKDGCPKNTTAYQQL